MKKINTAATILMFLGAINWGFIGLFDMNLIDFFIENTWGDRLVYILIFGAAVFKAVYWKTLHRPH